MPNRREAFDSFITNLPVLKTLYYEDSSSSSTADPGACYSKETPWRKEQNQVLVYLTSFSQSALSQFVSLMPSTFQVGSLILFVWRFCQLDATRCRIFSDIRHIENTLDVRQRRQRIPIAYIAYLISNRGVNSQTLPYISDRVKDWSVLSGPQLATKWKCRTHQRGKI